MKKQLREALKLKGDNEKLKNLVNRQKDKLKDHTKLTQEMKKRKQEMDKLRKENEMLKYEIETLKQQLQTTCSISNIYA